MSEEERELLVRVAGRIARLEEGVAQDLKESSSFAVELRRLINLVQNGADGPSKKINPAST